MNKVEAAATVSRQYTIMMEMLMTYNSHFLFFSSMMLYLSLLCCYDADAATISSFIMCFLKWNRNEMFMVGGDVDDGDCLETE